MAKGDPCACGCGEILKGNAHKYMRGHKPTSKSTPKKAYKFTAPSLMTGQSPDPEVVVYLSAAKVQRLLNLLLA